MKRLQHGGTRQPRNICHGIHHQGNDGQNIARAARRPHPEPSQLQTEYQQKQRRQQEAGHRHQQRSHQQNQPVGGTAMPHCGSAAQRQPQKRRAQHAHRAQPRRNAQRPEHHIRNFAPRLERYAPIAPQRAAQVQHKLLRHALIQMEAALKRRLRGGVGGFFAVKGAARDAMHGKKDDRRHNQYRCDRQKNPLCRVAKHRQGSLPPIKMTLLPIIFYLSGMGKASIFIKNDFLSFDGHGLHFLCAQAGDFTPAQRFFLASRAKTCYPIISL